jgi:hypothetical protein
MTRISLLVLLATLTTLGMETPDSTAIVTFNKDVFPILENNCQNCHRPGGIAPMSLMTYESTRPGRRRLRRRSLANRCHRGLQRPAVRPFAMLLN